MFVYGLLKQRVPPEINAVSTLMILASLVLVGASLLLQRRGADR
jgi:ABC-type spermidine/putrescine transport system permease subunit II